MFDRSDEVGRAECVVDKEKRAVRVGNLRNGVEVSDIAVGVAESFAVNNLCVGLYGISQSFSVVEIYNGVLNAACAQVVYNKVVSAAIEIVAGYDRSAACCALLKTYAAV